MRRKLEENEEIFWVPDHLREIYLDTLPKHIAEQDPVLFGAADLQLGRADGVMAVVESENGWEIIYIYVSPSRRRRGIARKMVSLCMTYMRAMTVDTLTCAYEVHDEEGDRTSLELFFEAMEFQQRKLSGIWKIRIWDVDKKMVSPSLRATSIRNIKLADATPKLWSDLVRKIEQLADQKSARSEVMYLSSISYEDYEPGVSLICVNQNMEPVGCILMRRIGQDIELAYLYADSSRVGAGIIIGTMIQEAFYLLKGIMNKDGVIYANIGNRNVRKMFSKAAGGKSTRIGKKVEAVKAVF